MARILIDEVEVRDVENRNFIGLFDIAVYSESYGTEPDEVKLITTQWVNGFAVFTEISMHRGMSGPYALFSSAAWKAALEDANMARLNAQFDRPKRDTFSDIRHRQIERV